MTDKPYVLYSAINIARSESAICIPLFMRHPHNELFVAVTDNEMNIIEFQPTDEFLSRRIEVPNNLMIDYCYYEGGCAPLIFVDNGLVVGIDGSDIFDIYRQLNSIRNFCGEIVDELINDFRWIIDHPQNREVEDIYKLPLSFGESDLRPLGSTLWLDQATQDFRILGQSEKITPEQIGTTRLRLLSWAKDLAENATTPIFSYFLTAARVAERAGVEVQDLIGAALLRRLAEDIPRRNRVIDLIKEFRIRYGRGPLASVLELRNCGVFEFEARADEVLKAYFEYVSRQLTLGNSHNITAAVLAADNGDQWPINLRDKIEKLRDHHLDDLLKKIAEYENQLERLRIRREEFRRKFNSGIFFSDLDRHSLKMAATKIVQTAREIEVALRLLDITTKCLSNRMSGDQREMIGSIDYVELGLNQDLLSAILGTTLKSVEDFDW